MSETKSKPALDVRYEIGLARTRCVARLPLIGRIVMQMAPRAARPEDNVPTAAIAPDGTAIFNADYLATLNNKQRAGVVAHEAFHPALLFWQRKGTRNMLLANIAHDLVINPYIEELSCGEIELPPGALLDPKFYGMAMEEVYNYLQHGDPGTPGMTNVKCKGGGEITIDTTSGGDPGGDGSGGSLWGDCRPDLADTPDGKKAAKGDTTAQKKLEGEWKMALAEAVQQHEARKSQGKLPAGLKRYIDELLHPQLDWTEELARWAGENGKREEYSFRRPHRWSCSVGVTLPSQCLGGIADVIFLLDSSGSMSKDEIKRGMSECSGILEAMGSEIRVLVCDADVHVDMTVDEATEVEIKGGGGSDFCPAFDLLEQEGFDGAVVAFTDGMINVPCDKPPSLKGCLWVTTSGYGPPSGGSWGEHIEMPDQNDDQ